MLGNWQPQQPQQIVRRISSILSTVVDYITEKCDPEVMYPDTGKTPQDIEIEEYHKRIEGIVKNERRRGYDRNAKLVARWEHDAKLEALMKAENRRRTE
jgi:hypothetical protein